MQNQYYIIGLLWIIWCFIHSLLASDTVNQWVASKPGRISHYFRIFYNIFAGISLIPVLWYGRQIEPHIIFQFSGDWSILQFLLVGLAVLFFWGGAREYDLAYFSGLKQVKSKSELSSEPVHHSTNGILQITRHPWYIGGIILIWSYEGHLSISGIISNTIICLYFIIGAHLEEKKLVKKFGSQYIDYQRSVSMLVPFKWIKLKLKI